MKVKQLIKELKKMPQDLEIGFAHSDAGAHSIDGWFFSIHHIKRCDLDDSETIQDDMPNEWIAVSD